MLLHSQLFTGIERTLSWQYVGSSHGQGPDDIRNTTRRIVHSWALDRPCESALANDSPAISSIGDVWPPAKPGECCFTP